MSSATKLEPETKKRGASKRIVAFDILRGFFLVVILIDHIELYPSGFDYFTGRGRLLVSAAEGFFFMSGLLVGMVYRRRIALGMKFIFKRMWRRAFQLYIASIFFTLFYTAAAVFLNHPSVKDGLYSVIDWPHIIKETVLMRYGYGWADFLDRFAILMFLAPFGFYLLAKRKPWLFIAVSFTAWLFRGSGFTLAWQVIFGGGMFIGYYWDELNARWRALSIKLRRRIKHWTFVLASVTFALSYASVYLLSVLNQKWFSLSPGLQSLTFHWDSVNAWVWLYAQKWTMGPIRIVLFLLWFAFLFMVVQRYAAAINRYTRNLLELLGRNSLFVYIAHSMIVFVFRLGIPQNTTLAQNFFITSSALVLLATATMIYVRLVPALKRRWVSVSGL